jgi:pimeloyl-ACP methyl ester carboxylesterase
MTSASLLPVICHRLGAGFLVLAALSPMSATVLAQAKPPAKPAAQPAAKPPAKPPVKTKEEEEKDKVPEPENVTLETKDDVPIKATYYASGPALKDKKKAVPIIMLHGWEGNRGEYHALASYLQKQGYAVICPDLRGHGQSLRYKKADGEAAEFDLEKMKGPEIEKMVFDVEAVKQFLVEKNNAGELNIEALCIIGAHIGGTIAMNWSAADWNVRSLPSFKQGQDVKAMILLSPVESFRGVSTRAAMGHPIVKAKLSTLICVGREDAKAYGDAKRMFAAMLRFHGKPPTEEKEAAKKQDLFFVEEETSLQGTGLLRNGLQTPGEIQKFLYLRLSLKLEEYEWSERKNPLKGE